MTDTNAEKAANGEASSGDADVDAITTPDPRANGAGQDAADDPEAPRAGRMGWLNRADYIARRGNDRGWKPAKEYIERTENEVPVLRERNRFLDARVAKQDAELEEIKKTSKEQAEMLREVLERTRDAEARGFAYTHREIEAVMDKAAADGDQEAYKRAKQALIDLEQSTQKAKPADKKPDAPEKKDDRPQPTPEVRQWLNENATWFNPDDNDDEASQFAILRDNQLRNKYPNTTVRLAKVKEAVERRFPEKFENPARKQPSPDNSPSGHANGKDGKKAKTMADLDDHARSAFEKF